MGLWDCGIVVLWYCGTVGAAELQFWSAGGTKLRCPGIRRIVYHVANDLDSVRCSMEKGQTAGPPFKVLCLPRGGRYLHYKEG